MRRRPTFFPLLVAGLLVSSCGATGEDAVEEMSPAERTFLEQKLVRVESGMSPAQVEDILGTPYRGLGTDRPTWVGPEGGRRSQVAVYFGDDGAFKVRWMHVGKFTWERDL